MNNETLLIAPAPIAPAPAEEKVLDMTVAVEGAGDVTTTGAEEPVTIMTAEVGMAENLSSAVQILGQGMASIFVVLGLIAVVVAVLKKLDNKKK